MSKNQYVAFVVAASLLGMMALSIGTARIGRVELGEQPDAVSAQLYALSHDGTASQVVKVQPFAAQGDRL